QDAMLFCGPYVPASAELREAHLGEESLALLDAFAARAAALPVWNTEALDGAIKAVLEEHGVKMPKLGIPLRVAAPGQNPAPAMGAVLALLGRETVLERLAAARGWRLSSAQRRTAAHNQAARHNVRLGVCPLIRVGNQVQ